MFNNLRISHNEIKGYDEASFDLTETVMDKFWSFFAAQQQHIARIGSLSGLCMWDGEEGLWLGIDALGGNINLCMETQRLYVDLWPEYDPLDCTEIVKPEENWIRFAPILRWIKDFIAA